MEESIFSKIIARQIPAKIAYEDEKYVVVHDIKPQAPVHLLVVPRTEQYANVVELAAGDPGLLAAMVEAANTLAVRYCGGQFRLVFNTGEDAGQTIFHVHAHLLGGKLAEGSLG